MKDLDEFYFMPYALDGTIDFYGRYNTIHPVPMTSGTDDKNGKAQAEYEERYPRPQVFLNTAENLRLSGSSSSAPEAPG